jgi:hypothetical protein
MKAPDPPVIQPDPILEQQKQQAQVQDIQAIQQNVKDDSASLMARYGALVGYAQGAKA